MLLIVTNLTTLSLHFSLGYFNTVWLVEVDSQPKFIIKFYGGNKGAPVPKKKFFDHGYGLDLETEICKVASKLKIGPHVYYTDSSCRVEEFIESTTFSFNSFFQPISNEFAKTLARFHCILEDINMDQYSGQEVDLFQLTRQKLLACKEQVQSIYVEGAKKKLAIGEEITLLSELLNLEDMSKKLKLKKVMINWDLNPLNILVEEKADSLIESSQFQTYLIDYEFAHPNYRCFDLGSIIHGATLQPLTGKTWSDEQIKNSLHFLLENFIKSYHDEYISVSNSCDIDEVDSWVNVTIEALFGACFIWIHYIVIRIQVLLQMCPDSAIGTLLHELEASFRFYKLTKDILFEKAPHLNQF